VEQILDWYNLRTPSVALEISLLGLESLLYRWTIADGVVKLSSSLEARKRKKDIIRPAAIKSDL
jgi:hypothetical protein